MFTNYRDKNQKPKVKEENKKPTIVEPIQHRHHRNHRRNSSFR